MSSLDDIFGPYPGRPQHEDYRLLVDVVLEHDAPTSEPTEPFDMTTHLAKFIDPDSLRFMAEQRTLRLMDHMGISHSNVVIRSAIGAVFLDAFMIGRRYQERKSEK